MDEGDRQCKDEPPSEETLGGIKGNIINVSNVFSTIRLRCIVQTYNEYKRIVLDSRRCVLFNFRFFLVGIYLTYEILK